MTLYINIDFRSSKFQTYSDRYGFKKFDYLLDCVKFIENNPLGIDYVRFDLGWYAKPMVDFCESIGMEYDKYFKIEPQTDYEFQEICKSMSRLE